MIVARCPYGHETELRAVHEMEIPLAFPMPSDEVWYLIPDRFHACEHQREQFGQMRLCLTPLRLLAIRERTTD